MAGIICRIVLTDIPNLPTPTSSVSESSLQTITSILKLAELKQFRSIKKNPKIVQKKKKNHLSTLKTQTARLNSSMDNSIGRKFGKIQYFSKSQTKIQFLVENTASNSINNDLFFVVRRLASAKSTS